MFSFGMESFFGANAFLEMLLDEVSFLFLLHWVVNVGNRGSCGLVGLKENLNFNFFLSGNLVNLNSFDSDFEERRIKNFG